MQLDVAAVGCAGGLSLTVTPLQFYLGFCPTIPLLFSVIRSISLIRWFKLFQMVPVLSALGLTETWRGADRPRVERPAHQHLLSEGGCGWGWRAVAQQGMGGLVGL
jgi:hypothetical protein